MDEITRIASEYLYKPNVRWPQSSNVSKRSSSTFNSDMILALMPDDRSEMEIVQDLTKVFGRNNDEVISIIEMQFNNAKSKIAKSLDKPEHITNKTLNAYNRLLKIYELYC